LLPKPGCLFVLVVCVLDDLSVSFIKKILEKEKKEKNPPRIYSFGSIFCFLYQWKLSMCLKKIKKK